MVVVVHCRAVVFEGRVQEARIGRLLRQVVRTGHVREGALVRRVLVRRSRLTVRIDEEAGRQLVRQNLALHFRNRALLNYYFALGLQRVLHGLVWRRLGVAEARPVRQDVEFDLRVVVMRL